MKLLPHTNIFYCKWWWNQWTNKPFFAPFVLGNDDNVDEIFASDIKYILTLQLILISECIFETIPQFTIQIYNAVMLDDFPIITIISITISSLILFALAWKYFWFLCIDRFCRDNGSEKTCYTQLFAIHHSFLYGFTPSADSQALERRYGVASQNDGADDQPRNNERNAPRDGGLEIQSSIATKQESNGQ